MNCEKLVLEKIHEWPTKHGIHKRVLSHQFPVVHKQASHVRYLNKEIKLRIVFRYSLKNPCNLSKPHMLQNIICQNQIPLVE